MSDLGLGDDNVESDCDRPVITNYPSFPGTSPSSAFSDAAVSSPSSPPPPQGPSQPSPTVSTRNANRRNAPMNPPVLSPLSSPSSRRPSRPAPTASVSHESWHEFVSEPVEQTLAPGFNWEPVQVPTTLPPLLRTPVQPTPLLVVSMNNFAPLCRIYTDQFIAPCYQLLLAYRGRAWRTRRGRLIGCHG